MAKYCINCGKELKDGNSCDCKKEIFMVQNEIVNKIVQLFKGMFIKPIDTIRDNTKSENFNLVKLFNGSRR